MVERAAKALRYYANDNATAVQMARDALLAALDPEDEALVSVLTSVRPARVLTRRNKAHDERQWEVVHDLDPDGPISDESYRVVERFDTELRAETFAHEMKARLNAKALIAALRAAAAQGEQQP